MKSASCRQGSMFSDDLEPGLRGSWVEWKEMRLREKEVSLEYQFGFNAGAGGEGHWRLRPGAVLTAGTTPEQRM